MLILSNQKLEIKTIRLLSRNRIVIQLYFGYSLYLLSPFTQGFILFSPRSIMLFGVFAAVHAFFWLTEQLLLLPACFVPRYTSLFLLLP